MNKATFIDELQHRLNDIPEPGRERAIEYYAEMIDDKIEEGMTEDEAVASTGDVDVIAGRIRNEYFNDYRSRGYSQGNEYNGYYSGTQARSGSGFKPWILIILILIPIFLPLIMVVLVLALVLIIMAGVLIAACYALTAASAFSGAYSVFAFMPNILSGNGAYGTMLLGMGLFLMGFSIFLFFASNKLTGFIFGGLFRLISRPFRGKSKKSANGGVQE